MNSILCDVFNPSDVEKAISELKSLGIKDLYILEDHPKKAIQVGGFIEHFPIGLVYSKATLIDDQIDWNAQSRSHSPFYKDGLIEVDLRKFCKSSTASTFQMNPGAGFGDISHETTHLMLSYLGDFVKDQFVIDMGCGNGILSFASWYMGAQKVIGLEIDPDSLKHAHENRFLNNLSNEHVNFKKTLEEKDYLNKSYVLLMNMTLEEQKQVIKTNFNLINNCKILILSGVLSFQSNLLNEILSCFKFNLLFVEKLNDWNLHLYIK